MPTACHQRESRATTPSGMPAHAHQLQSRYQLPLLGEPAEHEDGMQPLHLIGGHSENRESLVVGAEVFPQPAAIGVLGCTCTFERLMGGLALLKDFLAGCWNSGPPACPALTVGARMYFFY